MMTGWILLQHFEDLIEAVKDYQSGKEPKKLEDIRMKAAAARAYAKEQG